MKLEHRFSFFIFQLSEKMNDPNIHAFKISPKFHFLTKIEIKISFVFVLLFTVSFTVTIKNSSKFKAFFD